MRIDWTFPKRVFIALIIVSCLGAYPIMMFGTEEIAKATILGAFLTTVNVLLGYATIEISYGKSTTTFFAYVLGGMGVRLLLLASVLFLMIRTFKFHALALVGSMGIYYIVFLILEVLFIQKKVNLKQQK